MAASPSRSGSSAPSKKKPLHTKWCLSSTVPSALPWRGSRAGTTKSGRTRRWGMRRQTKSFIDAVPLTVAGASRRDPGTRPRAPLRRHGCQPEPRLELDSIWWPRPSEARGTWRRSRFDVETDCCGSAAFAGRGDVCLASERSIEWCASGISETSNPRPKALSASRSDLVLRARMPLFSVGECRWTTTAGHEPVQFIQHELRERVAVSLVGPLLLKGQ
jgi:hypothetical protein